MHIEVDDCPFSLFEKMHQPFLLWWSNPELELLNKLLRQDIEAAIDAIPAEFRAVLVLVELNGQSYAEAAEALGLPVGTVRSRLARARSRLQRALWEQARMTLDASRSSISASKRCSSVAYSCFLSLAYSRARCRAASRLCENDGTDCSFSDCACYSFSMVHCRG